MRIDEYERMFSTEETLWWYRGLRHFLQKQMSKYMPAQSENRLLDVGCGTGMNLQTLSTSGQAVGIDYSNEAIRFCRKRHLTQTAQGSICQLPFRDNTFDAITCMDVLGHSSILDDVAALKELYRVLKPGGYLFAHVAALEILRGDHDDVVMFSRRYSRTQFSNSISAASLRIKRLTFRNTIFLPPLLLHRRFNRARTGHEVPQSDVKAPSNFMNWMMETAMKCENAVTNYFNLPIGSSLFCAAQKPHCSN